MPVRRMCNNIQAIVISPLKSCQDERFSNFTSVDVPRCFFVQPSVHEITKLGDHRRQCHMQYHDAMEHSHMFRFKKALYSLNIMR